MRTRPIIVALAACAGIGGLVGCADRAQPIEVVPDGAPVEVSYHGQRYLAVPKNGVFYIADDIWIPAADLDSVGVVHDDIGTVRSGLTSTTGISPKWPNGLVTYSLANVVSNDRQAMRDTVSWWTTKVPGLWFTEVAGGAACPSGGGCIDVITSLNSAPNNQRCFPGDLSSNSIGRNASAVQVICVPPSTPSQALTIGMIAHEFGHAIGVHHEMTRSDRDSFVQMNWGEVSGCKTGAASMADCGPTVCEAGTGGTPRSRAIANGCCTAAIFSTPDDGTSGAVATCYRYGNYAIASPQALRSGYDFESIMHYSAGGFSKVGNATFTAKVPIPPDEFGNPVVPGQVDHLSRQDIAGVRVLYPVIAVQTSLYRNTGTQMLVQLDGRQQDINVRFTCTLAGVSQGGTVNTGSLSEGSTSFSCTGESPMWTLGYDYPNSTNTTWPASGRETFTKAVTLTVMNAGLIPQPATLL